MSDEDDKKLTHLLDGVEHAARNKTVSIADLLDEFGDRAITPFILIVCLLLISPVSGIPGVPTVGAVVIVILAAQALAGREQLWLPRKILNAKLSASKVRKGVDWMRKPCAWVDRHSHPRLRLLTKGPLRWLALVMCLVIPLTWPLLELLPFFTSIGAGMVSLLSLGLITRDGLYVLAGYVFIGLSGTGALAFLI